MTPENSKPKRNSEFDGLEAAQALYGGRAMHAERPPAIDTDEVVRTWYRIGLIILRGLSRKQLEGFDAAREALHREHEAGS